MNIAALETILSDKINVVLVNELVSWASGSLMRLNRMRKMTESTDCRISSNALWVIARLPAADSDWLMSWQDDMIDSLLKETNTGKKRLRLQLLRDMNYDADNIRSDFLDFCLSKINSECEPYAIRCYCIYIAFKMCSHYTELLAELEEHLDMMSCQSLSPGLSSALRNTKKRIKKHSLN